MKGILFAIVLALSPIVSNTTQRGYSANPDYEWVDLGLPSGVLWSSRNAGASSPEGFGKYYAAGGGWENDENGVLKLGHGGIVPSEENWKELWSYCTWEWVSRGVVNGWLVVSKRNNNSIFLPAAGYISGKTLKFADTQGYYASSTMDEDDENSAKYFFFNSRSLGNYKISRNEELTVRPVRKKGVISIQGRTDYLDPGVDFQKYSAIPDEDEDIEEEREDPIPFQLLEKNPLFRGGDANQFSKWVNERLVYPEIAKENGVQGKVMLQFTIEKDGRVTNVRVLRGVDPSIDKEAVRVVSSSPRWKPGELDGRKVRVTYTFPVIFQLR